MLFSVDTRKSRPSGGTFFYEQLLLNSGGRTLYFMGNYLIYQAYGNPDILNEALFSIISYLRQPISATVIVYTDNPAHFRAVLGEMAGVAYIFIYSKKWREWRGEINFVHQVKIKVL